LSGKYKDFFLKQKDNQTAFCTNNRLLKVYFSVENFIHNSILAIVIYILYAIIYD